MRRGSLLVLGMLMLAALPLAVPPALAPPDTFAFTAAGDHGFASEFNQSLARLPGSGADFHLALGDFRYGRGTEQGWCSTFKATFDPVVLIAGNHDVTNTSEGDIDLFAQYCPYPLPGAFSGTYAKEFWYDYPAASPLVRFILLSPGLNYSVNGEGYYDYDVGTPRYNWTRDAIDEARSAGVPWVVVGMHHYCFSSAAGCPSEVDIWNLLVDRKVDLVLQAHAHVYQRSHQVALNATTCPVMVRNVYDPDCVVDSGADRLYPRGGGTVTVIDGNFGAGISLLNASDPEAPYFAASMDSTTPGYQYGFIRYRVTATSIVAESDFAGAWQDSFVIGKPSPPTSVDAALENADQDVRVSWALPAIEADVDHYEVWHGATYSASRSGYSKASGDLPLGTTSWVDVGAGDAAGDAFYVVRAANLAGGYSESAGQAAKMSYGPLGTGHRLLSIPVITSLDPNGSFAGLGWAELRAWAAADRRDPWKTFRPAGPNDLTAVDRSLGLWVEVTVAGTYRVAGRVPCRTDIPLAAGWNLVGYPAMAPATVQDATSGLSGPVAVQDYMAPEDGTPMVPMTPSERLEPMRGYWIRSPVAQTWGLVNDPGAGCV